MSNLTLPEKWQWARCLDTPRSGPKLRPKPNFYPSSVTVLSDWIESVSDPEIVKRATEVFEICFDTLFGRLSVFVYGLCWEAGRHIQFFCSLRMNAWGKENSARKFQQLPVPGIGVRFTYGCVAYTKYVALVWSESGLKRPNK